MRDHEIEEAQLQEGACWGMDRKVLRMIRPEILTAKNKREDRGYQSPSRRHLSNVFRYSETPAIYDLNVFRGLLEGSSLGNCLRLHVGRQYMQSGNVY